MDVFKSLIVILLSSVLVNNYVLNRFLGICPFLGVSKKLGQSTGMGVSVTAVMLIATAVTWPIQYFVLDPLKLGYMQTIVFILVIAAIVQPRIPSYAQESTGPSTILYRSHRRENDKPCERRSGSIKTRA